MMLKPKIRKQLKEKNNKQEVQDFRKKIKVSHEERNGRNIIWLKVKDEESLLEILVKKENINKPNGDEDWFTLLHLATANNRENLAKKLLEKGANPNVKDKDGNTPLHFAAEENNLEIFKLLVENNANIDATNKNNWSILHSAASGIINKKEDWKIVELMLEKKVNIDVKTKNGIEVEDIFLKVDYSYVSQYEKLIEDILFSQIEVQ